MATDFEISGSGMGHDSSLGQTKAELRRKRSLTRNGASLSKSQQKDAHKPHLQEPHPHEPALGSFQDTVRETLERQEVFEAELKNARIAAQRRSFVTALEPEPNRDHMTAGGGVAGTHRVESHDEHMIAEGALQDNGGVSDDTVYLHKEAGLKYPTSEDMHMI